MEKLALTVEDGTKEMLSELAGGERRGGKYLSTLIHDEYIRHRNESKEKDLETTELLLTEIFSEQMRELKLRIEKIEQHLGLKQD